MTETEPNMTKIAQLAKSCTDKISEQGVQAQMLEIMSKQSQQQSKAFSKLHKRIPKDSKFNVYYEAKYHLESTTYQQIHKFDKPFQHHIKQVQLLLKANSKVYGKVLKTSQASLKKFTSAKGALAKTQQAVRDTQNLYNLEPSQKVEELLKKLQDKEKQQITVVNGLSKQSNVDSNTCENTGIDYLNKLQTAYGNILKQEKQFYSLISDISEIQAFFEKLKQLNSYAQTFDVEDLSTKYLFDTLKLSPNMAKKQLVQPEPVAAPILPNFADTQRLKLADEKQRLAEEEAFKEAERLRLEEEDLKRQQEEQQLAAEAKAQEDKAPIQLQEQEQETYEQPETEEMQAEPVASHDGYEQQYQEEPQHAPETYEIHDNVDADYQVL
ncbi:hypothetical protein SS50377_22701 [Spironucleus salmonicida]|uniref:Uncharacterized protein n=2 Tax=Spironucleus salmonicida TaxID=348837 RepID=A0A9P8LVH4_9EUKA|nr:hypothetical protein SS50377_22686 [Spironucleus salmonicida]KAH0575079.1 hypothetical protein SS50377_22701 [Spironucleus salmonicida]